MWPVRLYTNSHAARFSEKKLLNIKYILQFSTTLVCMQNFPFPEEFREISSQTCIGHHVKYPLFLSDFNENWIFSIDFRKKKNSNITFVLWSQTDGRTNGRNFAKAPTNIQTSRPALGHNPRVLFNWHRGSSTGVKRPQLEVNQMPLSRAEVKNDFSYLSTPPVCLNDVDRDYFTFYYTIFFTMARQS